MTKCKNGDEKQIILFLTAFFYATYTTLIRGHGLIHRLDITSTRVFIFFFFFFSNSKPCERRHRNLKHARNRACRRKSNWDSFWGDSDRKQSRALTSKKFIFFSNRKRVKIPNAFLCFPLIQTSSNVLRLYRTSKVTLRTTESTRVRYPWNRELFNFKLLDRGLESGDLARLEMSFSLYMDNLATAVWLLTCVVYLTWIPH